MINTVNKGKNTTLSKIKRAFFGFKFNDGIFFKTLVYVILIVIGFVYLFPIIHMLSTSFKTLDDLFNPAIAYIPSSFYFGNYISAFNSISYFKTLMDSLAITLVPAIVQTAVVSLIGYGFARYQFPLKKMWLLLAILTYVIPAQAIMIPKYVLFNKLGWLSNPLAIIMPATFGQGLSSAVFILIFYNFYRLIPKVLDEAAEIDGAGQFYIYFKIAIPLSIPSFITTFLFSFVWYWNETYIASMFMGSSGNQTLHMVLDTFLIIYQQQNPGQVLNEGIRMAATLLIILPMLIVYAFLQRKFIEGIDKSGITGE